MIYYFSGTGNSEWVAKQLGNELKEDVVNIADLNGEEGPVIKTGESVGFVFPIYAWAPPEIMMTFIKKIKLEKDCFAYAVCTCESEAGNAFKILKKEVAISSAYSISMPNNYIISVNVDSDEVVKRKIGQAKESIYKISQEVVKKQSVWRVEKGNFSLLKSAVIAPLFNKYARKTNDFYVEDACIACGLCEKVCPTHCIKLDNEKPIWNGKCTQCLSCINRCPKQAIQKGNKTKNHGRYYFKEI